jgi:hypothetical protein
LERPTPKSRESGTWNNAKSLQNGVFPSSKKFAKQKALPAPIAAFRLEKFAIHRFSAPCEIRTALPIPENARNPPRAGTAVRRESRRVRSGGKKGEQTAMRENHSNVPAAPGEAEPTPARDAEVQALHAQVEEGNAAEAEIQKRLQRKRRRCLNQALRVVRLTAIACGNVLAPGFYQCPGELEEEEAAKEAQSRFYGSEDGEDDENLELLSLQEDCIDTLDEAVSLLYQLSLTHDDQIRSAAHLPSTPSEEDEEDETPASGAEAVVTAA